MLHLYSTLCFILASATIAQTVDTSICPCENTNSGASWIESDEHFCSGCDPIVTRRCRLSDGSVLLCRVNLTCPVSECQGSWSGWYNIERCGNSCGYAMRQQARTCYMNVNVRTRLCRGGFGKSEENRYETCRSCSGCNGTACPTQSLPDTSTTTATTRIMTTSTIPTTSTSTVSDLTTVTTTTKATVTTFENSTSDSNQSLNLILFVALGCIGVILLVILIIVLIVCCKRSKKEKKRTAFKSESKTNHTIRTEKGTSHFYEELEFDSPPTKYSGKKHVQGSINSSNSIPNALYSTSEYMNSPEYEAPNVPSHRENKDFYLQPTTGNQKPFETPEYMEFKPEDNYVSFYQASKGDLV